MNSRLAATKIDGSFIILLFLIVGLFFPTSSNGMISKELMYVQAAVLFILLLASLLRRIRNIDARLFLLAISNIAILLLFSIFTITTEYAYGAIISYLLLSILYCCDFKNIKFSTSLDVVFIVINFVNIILAALIVFGNSFVDSIFIQNYSAYYPSLVYTMLLAKKPVLMFATHSVAGFYFFLFFYLNFITYTIKKELKHIIFALSYVVLLVFIKSFTSIAFFGLAIVQLGIYFLSRKPLVVFACILSSFVLILIYHDMIMHFFMATIQFESVLTSKTNGIAGRYFAGGNLVKDISYVLEHPLSPIGLGNSDRLFIGDSGIIENLLRGSVFLVMTIYIGFWIFLRRNIKEIGFCYFVFFVYLFFEVGFANLNTFRAIYFLPFLIVYLNWLTDLKERKGRVFLNGTCYDGI